MSRPLYRPLRALSRFVAALFMLAGAGALGLLGLACTNIPYRVYCWRGADPAGFGGAPDFIVVRGGGGVPSESGLMRAYYGAQAGRRYPSTPLILAVPYEGELEGSAAGKMRTELILRGIAPERIRMESAGRNTREQVIKIRDMLGSAGRTGAVLIVTSPNHMRRAVKTFGKAGFNRLAGLSTFGQDIELNLTYDARELGGRTNGVTLPAIEGNLFLRYQFWNNLGTGLRCLQELVALAYYRWKGWI